MVLYPVYFNKTNLESPFQKQNKLFPTKSLNPDQKYLNTNRRTKNKMHPSPESSGRWTNNKKQSRLTPPAYQDAAPTPRVKLNWIYCITILTLTSTIYHASNIQPYICSNNVAIKLGKKWEYVMRGWTMRVVCFYQWFYYFNGNNLKRQSSKRKIGFVHLINLRSHGLCIGIRKYYKIENIFG